LAAGEGEGGAGEAAGKRGAGAAAEREADEEDGEDDRKRVDGGAEEEGQLAGPADFGGEGAEAGEREGSVEQGGGRKTEDGAQPDGVRP
jgi:hypothetical protein